MVTRSGTIQVYQNSGALLTLGPSQVLSFTNFQTPLTRSVTYSDADPGDREWDFGESGTLGGQPASLFATGTAFAGVNVTLLGIPLLSLQLSTPVNVAVIASGGQQYLRLYNPDGTSANPTQLLNGLVGQLVTGLTNLGPLGPLLQPLVNGILANPLAYLQQNALLTMSLSASAGLPVVTCFVAGTRIMTREGERLVEDLRAGDEVQTLDHGLCRVRWAGRRTLTTTELIAFPRLRPVQIQAGALGQGIPRRTLTVSPHHRCLLRSKIAMRMTGQPEVLVEARHLTSLPGINAVETFRPLTYVHILFDRHELIFSDGAITESFYLGAQAMRMVDAGQHAEILALFPGLAAGAEPVPPTPARSFMAGQVARQLVARAIRNHRAVVELDANVPV